MALFKNAKTRRLVITCTAVLVFLIVYIDDWGRDFISHEAEISSDTADESLRPLSSGRSHAVLVEAVKMAAHRISNWEYIGEVGYEEITLITFVRTHRLLRLKNDITIRVEDLGKLREISGESRSRLEIGDLGRNPRNLRRLLQETRTVLKGSAPQPMLQRSQSGERASTDLVDTF